jgi:hypothetical protein
MEREENFEPLRKKLKTKSSGKETNFMPSYYSQSQRVAAMTQEDVAQVLYQHDIRVSND